MSYVAIPAASGGGGTTFSGWSQGVFAQMLAASPTLTGFKSIPLGQATQGAAIGAVANDGALEGGGMGWASAFKQFGVQLFKLPKTGAWAFAMDIFLPAPVTGQSAQAGIANVAGAHTINIQTNFATDTTHFVVVVNTDTTATTVVSTGQRVTALFVADGTNVRVYINATLVRTVAQSVINSDEAMYPYAFESGASLGAISEIAWGFVGA